MNFLIAATLAFSPFSYASDCLDKKLDSKIAQAAREKGKDLLDGKNKSVVPRGLPDEEYPQRNMKVVASFRGDILVFFYFANAQITPGFLVPYTYHSKTGILEPISVPDDLGNGDSRLWDVKTKVVSKCGTPKIKITYDACYACGGGDDMGARFWYDLPAKKWLFFVDNG